MAGDTQDENKLKKNGIYMSPLLIGIFVALGLLTILAVGLISGLVFRKICSGDSSTLGQGGLSTTTKSTTQVSVTITPSTLTTTSTITTTTTTATTGTASTTTGATRTTPSITQRTTTTSMDLGAGIWDSPRLPTYYVPNSYDVSMKLSYNPSRSVEEPKGNVEISGSVTIDFNLMTPIDQLLFHAARNVEIQKPVRLVGSSETLTLSSETQFYARNEYYYVKLSKTIQPGAYKLSIDYKTKTLDLYGKTGIFEAVYNEDSRVKTVLATKFEPVGARKAFPCFDEPQLKANFTLTLEHPSNTKAISNYPAQRTTNANGMSKTEFRTTSKLSTHLFAWVIMPQDYANKSINTFDRKPITIYARKNAVQSGYVDYALEYAKNALDHIRDQYLNLGTIDALSPKIDLIALPDYQLKETSNLGLLVFREASLLFNDKEDSSRYQQEVTKRISSGIAAQWFGAYVSPAWWNEIWLSKSISNFIGYKAIHAQYPLWKIHDQFIVDDIIPSMWHDGFESSHPLVANVSIPDEIVNLFDEIAYKKGPSIVRMLESVVGEANLRKSLQDYLLRSRNGVGNVASFYQSLILPSEMNGKTTAEQFMNSWLVQKNFPEVYIDISRNTNGTSTVLFIQSRFLLSEFDEEEDPIFVSPLGYKWQIYLQCKAGGTYAGPQTSLNENQNLNGADFEFDYFLNAERGNLLLNRQYTWVKCNKDFQGYYITDYSANIFQAFTSVLKLNSSKFSPADRANLIHNSYELAFLGSKTYKTPAELSQYLRTSENEYVPWATFSYHVHKIGSILEHRPVYQELSAFGIYIASTIVSKSNLWDAQGTHVEKLWKNLMIELLCRLQDEKCLLNATSYYEKIPAGYFTSPNTIKNPLTPNIRLPVYSYHIQNTYDYLDWDNVFSVYRQTENPGEQLNALIGLSNSRVLWILSQYLDELLKPNSRITKEDFLLVLNTVSRHPTGRYKAWYFLRHFWNEITALYSINDPNIGRTIRVICASFEDEYLLVEMLDFFATNGLYGEGAGALEWSKREALDIVRNNIFWVLDREPDVLNNLLITIPITTTTRITTTRTTTRTTGTATRTIPELTSRTTTPQDQSLIGSNPRLPKNFIPLSYDLDIRVYFTPVDRTIADKTKQGTGYDGVVNIRFNLTSQTDEIYLHADQELNILDPIEIQGNQVSLLILNQQHRHVKNDYYYIKLNSPLPIGIYTIRMQFDADYTKLYGNAGIFSTSYYEDSRTKTIVSTKFEPTNARKGFPCFDEPQLKATYSLSIEHPLNTFAISNTPIKSETTLNSSFVFDGGYVKTVFETTPRLSTHQLAFVVAPDSFAMKTVMTTNSKLIRLYARKNALNAGFGDWSLNFTRSALSFIENTYLANNEAVPSKIDLVALPDFQSKEVSHFGLISFRESNLLYHPNENSAMDRQRVAHSISNGLAGLWFGAYVTCEWWSDVWMDKSVANFVGNKAINSLFPDWKIDEQFIAEDLVPVMWEDGYASSHPLSANVTYPDEIINLFDSITFSKGPAILRMIESTTDSTNVQMALRNYLQKNRFSSGKPSDFYSQLQLPADMSTKTTPEKYIFTWIKQMNYPEVVVQLRRNGSRTTVAFEQARFQLTEYDEDVEPIFTSEFGYRWEIYLKCRAGGVYDPNGSGTQHLNGSPLDFTIFLNTDKQERELDRAYTWVKCNQGFKGFYVTDYSDNIWQAFTTALSLAPGAFEPIDRANLIHNAYQLAFLDRSYKIPASLSAYMRVNENEYVPWKVFQWHVYRVSSIMEHRPVFQELSAFGLYILGYKTSRTNLWDGQGTHLELLWKNTMLDMNCRLQDENCLLNATKYWTQVPSTYYLSPNSIKNPLNPNIRQIVYNYHIQNTYDYDDCFNIFEVYRYSDNPSESQLALASLSFFRATWGLSGLLQNLLPVASAIKNQDFFTIINLVSKNPSGRYISWYFLRHYWDELVNKFSVHDIELHRSFAAVTETFEDAYLYEEMTDFFAQHPNEGAGAWLRQQARDIVKNNIFWVIDRELDIYTSLLLNVPLTTTTRITTTRTSTNTATRTTPSLTQRTTTTANIDVASLWNDTRLPKYFIPNAYDLTIRVNFNPNEKSDIDDVVGFSGQVTIDFNILQATTEIIFHADRALTLLDPIEIYSPNGGEALFIDDEFHQNIQNDFYYINVNQLLQPGNYKMKIGFRGRFTQVYSNTGLFTASYVEDSKTKTIAATKFEPLGARRVFPCFDEPQLKANFTLTLQHPLETKAISNYPIKNSTNNGPYLTTMFQTTSKVSTHLFAWVIMPQDYANKSINTFDRKPITIYARKNAVQSGYVDYALEYAKNALDHIRDQYLNLGTVDALSPKIDLIALPDYQLKETSNLGLLVFREASLLFNDKEDSSRYQQEVTKRISSGIAAQWFGAYVSPAWWNEIWLSKSISNFIGYKAIHAQYPLWKIHDQFIVDDIIPSMWHDGFESSHPLVANVSIPDEIVNLFDEIAYKKGPSIVRMLESVVGEANLRKSLQDYLLRSRNGVGNVASFYQSLILPSEMNGKTTAEQFVNSWLVQKNYPEVGVSLSYQSGSTRVSFSQARFLQTEYDEELLPIFISPLGYKWEIFLQCIVGGTAPSQHTTGVTFSFNFFLQNTSDQFTLPGTRQYTWIKCNKEFKGHYITDYSPSVFNALTSVLNTNASVFSPADRANLIHNSYELAFLGSKTYKTPSELSQYLRTSENEYVPWATFNYHMHKISKIVEHRPGYVELSAFGVYIAQALSDKVDLWNMSGLSHVNKIWRMSMIELLCSLQDEACLNKASTLYATIPNDYFTSPNTIKTSLDPNVRFAVYRYHIQNTYDYFDWDNVFSVYKKTENPEEELNALISLSYSRSTWILAQYLDELLKPNSAIKKEDFLLVIGSISSHAAGRAKAWYFLRHFWNQILAKFTIQDPNIGRTFRYITESFEDEFMYSEMIDFMAEQGYYESGAGAGEWNRRLAIDIVVNNIFWVLNREDDLDSNLLVSVPQTSTTRVTTTRTTTAPTSILDNIRLPKWISPNSYNLTLRTFFEPEGQNARQDSTGFEGTAIIDFNLNKSSDEIIFHCYKDLDILDPIRITGKGESFNIVNELHEHVKNDFYYIKLFRQLNAGQYKIELKFKSKYQSLFGNTGLFANSYNEDGKVKTLLATKFEPTEARKVFPCFDEPQLKAPFTITLEHPLNTKAISNFPEIDSMTNLNEQFSQNKTGLIRTRFQTTFKMSTYLAAWVVLPSDFGNKSTTSADGKRITVYARKQAVEAGYIDFALNVTKLSIDYFQNTYFNISDAVPPKVDMIAIPDYVTGAMENWGLVGFRETRLLYSDSVNSVAAKQSVALTIAHELAHFWFGNLVTCAWWNDLWLNEAMATFLEYNAIEYIFPEWRIQDQFLIDETLPVMWDDAYLKSHPIEADVQTPDQINSVFDSITYSKGAAVLRMLESVVSPTGFQKGLQNYLLANKFSSGVAADFYNSLVLPDDMRNLTTPEKFMNSWIKQKNYPSIKINLARNTTTQTTTFSFEQTRYLLAKTNTSDTPSPFNYQWEIYLQCQAGGVYNVAGAEEQHTQGTIRNFSFFLNANKGLLTLNGQFTWIKCNTNFGSFYISSYSDDIFEGLIQVLNTNSSLLSSSDRANLMHNMFMLAFNGEKSYEIPSELSNYLEINEIDYVPWKVFTWHMTKLAALLEHRVAFFRTSTFGSSIAQILSTKFDLWSNEGTQTEKLLKANTIEFLCRMQSEQFLLNATNYFNTIPSGYYTSPNNVSNPLSQNVRASIYKYHIQNSYDYEDWIKLQQVYKLTSDPQEQALVLQALAYSRSTWTLSSYLEELLKPNSFIKIQDFFSVITYISRNPGGRSVAWYFLRQNWDKLVLKFGLNNRTFGNSIKSVTSTFETQFLYNEMIKFFASKPDAGAGEQPREQAKEIVLTNIEWIKTRERDLLDNLIGPDGKQI